MVLVSDTSLETGSGSCQAACDWLLQITQNALKEDSAYDMLSEQLVPAVLAICLQRAGRITEAGGGRIDGDTQSDRAVNVGEYDKVLPTLASVVRCIACKANDRSVHIIVLRYITLQ